MKEAIIVIDMLEDFVYGSLACQRAADIVPNIKCLLEEARKNKIPVIFANDAHLPGDPEMRIWGEHAMQGTKGAEVVSELSPGADDFVLGKRNYSAFVETGLMELLRSLKVDTMVITGIHTHLCCQHTAADAFQRGFNLLNVQGCMTAFTEEDHITGMEYMKNVYGIRTLSFENWIAETKASEN